MKEDKKDPAYRSMYYISMVQSLYTWIFRSKITLYYLSTKILPAAFGKDGTSKHFTRTE
jgi:hypothetical protein